MTVYLIACAILVAFSAFFSSVEIALTSLNRLRLQRMAEDGNKGARIAEKIETRYPEALTTILIGNNVVNLMCYIYKDMNQGDEKWIYRKK